MSRRSGKTVELIRSALDKDAAILVSDQVRKEQICLVAKALGVDVEQRTFVCARGSDKQTLTLTDIKAAIDILNQPKPTRYFFLTDWLGKAWGDDTDAKCIEYFNGSGVVVVDRKCRCWLNGQPYGGGIDRDMVALIPKRDCK